MQTIDQKIAQLQAIRDEHGGHLLVLGIQELPVAEFRKVDGGIERYAIRYFPEVVEGSEQ
ncbi:hypothetical protein N015_08400 [Pseudomonas asturiensis]|uniref:Uncharacterized protein n=1 Tax=Pseudomonas asturiensis TaxID=1190415 RepID=A0ABX6HAP4_9PSED|nr:hypothetical protein [Pseudomonas asturiensis]QHF02429.1 hypothetical protein N015_08400 [Pseudomonas asturiensis]